MPERATVAQGVQVGKETTYGTSVAAGKKLSALSMKLTPNLTFQQGGPSGYKADTYAFLTKNFTDVDLSNSGLSYDDIVYALSSCLCLPVITTPTNGVLTRLWTFAPSPTAADAVASYTVEQGDGTTNEKASGVLVTDLEISIDRDGNVTVGGKGFAKAMSTGITLTTTPTVIPLKMVSPTSVSVYVDAPGTDLTTWDAAFGTTKLTRVRMADLKIGGRFGQYWALDAAQASYAATAELKPSLTLDLTMERDAAGTAFLANAAAGDTRAIRVEAVGSVIESVTPTYSYKLTMDFAGVIVGGGGISDNNGIQETSWSFDLVADPLWLKYMRVAVTNTLTAL